jgi:hypothetical protein
MRMRMETREEERPSQAPEAPLPHRLLGLQATAGNQAVTRMLGRRRLARLAVVMTTKQNAIYNPTTATTTQVSVVDKVQIGDRPKGLFGGASKSHATGWETFCDGLRFDVMGQTLDVALSRVEALYQFALNLAAMTRVAMLPQATSDAPRMVDDKPAEYAEKRHNDATDRASKASAAAAAIIATPGAFSSEAKIEALQEFAAAYLQLRNTVPLAAMNLDHAGGRAPLEVIRAYETGGPAGSADALNKALWKQLDIRVVARLASASLEARDAPGIDASLMDPKELDAERAKRVVDVVLDHLASMQATYPRSYAYANMAASASVRTFLESIAGEAKFDSDRLAFPKLWVPELEKAILGGTLPTIAPHPGRTANLVIADAGKRFAVQLVTGLVGTETKVKRMEIGGRPAGPFASTPGAHTTAWAVLVDHVRALVVDKTVAEARTALTAYGDELASDANRVDAMDDRARESLEAAESAYADALALTDPPAPLLLQAQAIAGALLMLLNTMPFSAILGESVSNPADEKSHRKAAIAANVAGPEFAGQERWTLIGHLWALLDPGTLRMLLNEDTELAQLPGALPLEEESGAIRTAVVIDEHLSHMDGAYDKACLRAKFDTLESLMFLLNQPMLEAHPDVAIAIAVKLNHEPVDARTAYVAAGGTLPGSQPKRKPVRGDESGKRRKVRDTDDFEHEEEEDEDE